MSYYTYLIRKDNKTMYNLGKNGIWNVVLAPFKVPKKEPLFDEDIFGEESDIPTYDFSDRELLFLAIQGYFDDPEVFDEDYHKFVTDSILDFCDGHEVYYVSDLFDTYTHLKRDFGYKVTFSRYIDDGIKSDVPRAEDFLKMYNGHDHSKTDGCGCRWRDAVAMRMYARAHVKAALESVLSRIKIEVEIHQSIGHFKISKESVLDSYPENLIK